MRLFLGIAVLASALLLSGCVGGRADANNNAARADLLFGRSF